MCSLGSREGSCGSLAAWQPSPRIARCSAMPAAPSWRPHRAARVLGSDAAGGSLEAPPRPHRLGARTPQTSPGRPSPAPSIRPSLTPHLDGPPLPPLQAVPRAGASLSLRPRRRLWRPSTSSTAPSWRGGPSWFARTARTATSSRWVLRPAWSCMVLQASHSQARLVGSLSAGSVLECQVWAWQPQPGMPARPRGSDVCTCEPRRGWRCVFRGAF